VRNPGNSFRQLFPKNGHNELSSRAASTIKEWSIAPAAPDFMVRTNKGRGEDIPALATASYVNWK
jgi:hypothetical protein